MKRKTIKNNPALSLTPEQAVRFLEDIRLMQANINEPSVPISIRIPGNLLRALKLKAANDGKKYQSLIVEYIRKGLQERS
ncbi:MAG: hypothetical protein BroJett040_13480 [Oligoflexia bacterium]|nr:MAG: hypothetical protein BroJett040_13480 [Oligoflexia bacterium]